MRKIPLLFCALLACVMLPATAATPSTEEAAAGLKAALNQGATKAIALLGRQDGFFGNSDVHIPLPGKLQKGRKMLEKLGLKKQIAALELALNRAAEAAVPQAQQLFVDSIRQMSPADALSIVKGPADAATRYFRDAMSTPLTAAFMPIVGKTTAQVDLARKYDLVASRAAALGLVEEQDASLDAYVTRKALDGLFLMMAREEAAIRKDPLGQADALLKEVFGR